MVTGFDYWAIEISQIENAATKTAKAIFFSLVGSFYGLITSFPKDSHDNWLCPVNIRGRECRGMEDHTTSQITLQECVPTWLKGGGWMMQQSCAVI